jgi:hypothetical protein
VDVKLAAALEAQLLEARLDGLARLEAVQALELAALLVDDAIASAMMGIWRSTNG